MHLKSTLSLISGILFVAAFVPYIRAIVRDRNLPTGSPDKTEPEKATWIIWTLLDTMTLTGMFVKHTVNGQIVGAVLGAWITLVLALKYGKPGWKRLDKICLGSAILGIVLWKVTHNPLIGMTVSLTLTFIGALPTFASSWKDPSKEDRTAWTIFFISCVVAMFAIPRATIADAAQPTTFFVIETVMVIILYLRPRMLVQRVEFHLDQ